MEERNYYVYRHLRNDTGRPMYVGRGKKRDNRPYPSSEYERAFTKKGRSDYWHNIVNKYGHEVEIMVDDLTFEESVEKEKEFIKLYGFAKDGGLLCNLSSGGEGNKDMVYPEEAKQKLRDINSIPLEQHIQEDVFPEPNTGCWLWTGTIDKRYDSAVVNLDNRSGLAAHKVIYEYLKGVKVPDDKRLFRSCNNKICVNPDHCYIDNPKGITKKGEPRTWRQHLQKLNENDVREIRTSLAEGISLKELGTKYKVSDAAIYSIKSGKTWAWLK